MERVLDLFGPDFYKVLEGFGMIFDRSRKNWKIFGGVSKERFEKGSGCI